MYVVIGGSDGLGKALVASIKDINATVMNISRRPNAQADHNISCDLSTQKGILTAVNEIKKITEPLDAIIISAGVFSFKDIHELDEGEYTRIFDLNTKAPFLLISPLVEIIKKVRCYFHQLYSRAKIVQPSNAL